MTVWVVHPVRDNLQPAEQYGKLQYVQNGGYVYPDELRAQDNRLPDWTRALIGDAVQRFDVNNDFVLVVGDHLQLILFTTMLGVTYGRYRVLRYDREAQGYYPVLMDALDWSAHRTIKRGA